MISRDLIVGRFPDERVCLIAAGICGAVALLMFGVCIYSWWADRK